MASRPTKAQPPAADLAAAPARNGPSPKRYPAARVRKAIVQALAPDKELTPTQVKAAVAKLLPAADRASIDGQINVLRDKGDVSRGRINPRRLALTESGQRWWRGIKALSPEPVSLEERRARKRV